MEGPPSPTNSVRSISSNASEAKAAKVPAAIAKAGKEDLQKMLMDTLKKLKIRDKKLAEATKKLSEAAEVAPADGNAAAQEEEIASLTEQLEETRAAMAGKEQELQDLMATHHQACADLQEAKAEIQAAAQRRASDLEDSKTLAKSTQDALLVAQNRIDELTNALQGAEAGRQEAEERARAADAEIIALQEQVQSFKMAVDNMAGAADEARSSLSEEVAGLREQLGAAQTESARVQGELAAAQDEAACAASAYEELATAKDQVVCLEEALHESNDAARKKVAELEAALEGARAEHVAAEAAQEQLDQTEKLADGLRHDQEAAKVLVAELEATLDNMQQENSRLQEALTKAEGSAAECPESVSVVDEVALNTLQLRVTALEGENERLMESEAQTSQELAVVMAKLGDSERRAAQMAVMDNSMEAIVGVAEQHAEDMEFAFQGLSVDLRNSSNALLEVIAKYEKSNAQAFTASLAVTSLMDAHLDTLPDTARSVDASDVAASAEGISADLAEKTSLQAQLVAMQERLESEMKVRSELEHRMAKTEGQLVGANMAMAASQGETNKLKSEVSQLAEILSSPGGQSPSMSRTVSGSMPRATSTETIEMKSALRAKEEELSAMGAELETLRTALKDLQASEEQARSALAEGEIAFRAQVADVQWQLANVGEANGPTEEMETLRRDLDAANAQAASQAETCEALRAQLEVMEALRSDLEAAREELRKSQTELEVLKAESLQNQLEAAGDAQAGGQVAEALQLELEAAMADAAASREIVGRLKKEVEDLKTRLESSEATKEAMQHLVDDAKARLQTETSARANAESAVNAELSAKVEGLEASLEEAKQLSVSDKEAAEAMRSEVEDLRAQVATLKSDAAAGVISNSAATGDLEASLTEAQQLAVSHEEAAESLRSEVEDLQALVATLESEAAAQAQRSAAATGELSAQVKELEASLAEAKQRAVSHEEAAESLRSEVDDLQAQVEAQVQQLEVRQQELREAHNQQEELERNAKALEAKLESQQLQESAAAEAARSAEKMEELQASLAAKEKEISDSKKKFLSVAKKKQAEFNKQSKDASARIAELEAGCAEATAKAAAAEAALDEARGQVRMREKELERIKDDLKFMQTEVTNSRSHSEASEQLKREAEAKEYELAAVKQDLEEALHTAREREHELDQVKTKAREEREAMTSRLEEEVERLEASHTQAVEDMRADLLGEYNSDVAHLKETHERAMESLRAQLEKTEREMEEANEAALRAESRLEDLSSQSQDSVHQSASKISSLSSELGASQALVETLKKDHESDREKVKKAMAELKKKAERAERAQRKAEVMAAELRGKNEAEKEVLRRECASASTQVALAKEELQRVEGELREYRTRAHALLQRKEEELRSKLSGGSASQGEDEDVLREAAKEAQSLLVQARQERNQMARSLEESEQRWASENEEIQTHAAAIEEALRGEVVQAKSRAEAAAAASQASQARAAELEAQLGEALTALDEAVARKADGRTLVRTSSDGYKLTSSVSVEVRESQTAAVRIVQAKLDALLEEYDSFRETTEQMGEAKDREVSKLLESNAQLREEMAAMRTSAGAPRSPATRPQTSEGTSAGGYLQSQEETTAGWQEDHWTPSGMLQLEDPWDSNTQERPKEAGELLGDVLGPSGGLALVGDSADQLLQIAKRQARRDDELAEANRRVHEFEAELTELRKEVELREEQEKVLKEALRENAREDARLEASKSNFDMEYLKNVVIQFVCTRQQEALLPVVSQVLHLSPSEMEKCQVAMQRYKAEEESSATDFISSTASSWLGGGSWGLGG